MLFLKPGTSDLVRAQGTFVDDSEVKRVVKYLREIAEPQFHPELTQLSRLDASEFKKDDLFDEAVRIVMETRRGSVSLLQRRLNIGYARASRIIEMMAAVGVLGQYKGSQAREVTITPDEYEQLRQNMEAEAAEYESAGQEVLSDNNSQSGSQPNAQDQPSLAPAEGEYHYAAVEEED